MLEVIDNEDFLLRRVPALITDPLHIKEDGTPTSVAFSRRHVDKDGLSVDIEKFTTPQKAVIGRTKFRLFKIRSGYVRSLGLDCVHAPEPSNYAHALITGDITKGIARKLASEAGKSPVEIPDDEM